MEVCANRVTECGKVIEIVIFCKVPWLSELQYNKYSNRAQWNRKGAFFSDILQK